MLRAAATFHKENGFKLERAKLFSGSKISNLTVFEKKWADLFMSNWSTKATVKNKNEKTINRRKSENRG